MQVKKYSVNLCQYYYMMRKYHPLYILYSVKQFLPMLAVPAVRGLIAALRDHSIRTWLSGIHGDVFIILLIILCGMFWWDSNRYRISKNGITFARYIISGKEIFLPFSKVHFMNIKTLVFAKAKKVKIITADKTFSFTLSNIHTKYLEDEFLKNCSKAYAPKIYDPPMQRIMLYALGLSTVLPGVIFLGTILLQVGNIIGGRLRIDILETAGKLYEERYSLTLDMLSRAGTLVALVLLCGYIVGVIRTLYLYYDFRVEKYCDLVKVDGHNKYLFYPNAVESISQTRTKVFAVFPRQKWRPWKNRVLLVPYGRKNELNNMVENFLN